MTEFWDKIRGHILKDIYIDDDDLIIVTDRGCIRLKPKATDALTLLYPMS